MKLMKITWDPMNILAQFKRIQEIKVKVEAEFLGKALSIILHDYFQQES